MLRPFENLTDSEVTKLNMSLVVDQNTLWTQISKLELRSAT